MSLFFIKRQHQKLDDKLQELKENHIKIKLKDATGLEAKEFDTSYQLYSIKTKSWKGWFKSLVPWTYEFKVRVICSDRMNALNKMLNNPVKSSKKTEKQLKLKSQSDSDLVVKESSYKKLFQPNSKSGTILTVSSKQFSQLRM